MKILPLLFSLIFAQLSAAQDLLDITADNVTVNNTKGRALYVGNVVIIYGVNKINAHRVVITQSDDLGNKMKATAQKNKQVIYENTSEDKIKITANSATYVSANKTITFIGDVVAKATDSRLESDRLTYNTQHQKIIGTANKNGRVSTLINF